MTHRILAVTAATSLAIMGSVVAATTGTAPARAAASCVPSWQLRTAPPAPGSDSMNVEPIPGGQDTATTSPALSFSLVLGENSINSISAISPGDAVLTGADLVPLEEPWMLHWDGQSLSTVTQPGVPGAPLGDAPVSSLDSDTDGWQTGPAVNAHGPAAAPVVERWHDGRWTVTPTAILDIGTESGGFAGFGVVKAISPNDAWLIGEESPGGATVSPLIEHWDGTQWSVVPNPASALNNATLAALTVIAPNDIWAVGQDDSSGNPLPLALHWNGTSWQQTQVPAGNGGIAELTAVSAAGPNDVWAVGAQLLQAGSDLAAPLAEHWDGSAWTVSQPDQVNGLLSGVYAAGPGDVWAAGGFATGLPSVFLHLVGKTWTTVPTPGPAEFAMSYFFTQVSGTGPDDVWALGSAANGSAATFNAFVAHLGCGEGS